MAISVLVPQYYTKTELFIEVLIVTNNNLTPFTSLVNVNNRDYKIMMETEAFKEENSGTAPSLGDLAPKRQWRSPKRAATYFSQQVQKK